MNILLEEQDRHKSSIKAIKSNPVSCVNISKSTDFNNKLGLNFSNLPRQSDFNQEFLENFADFSPSWRKEVEKINLSKLLIIHS
jgi:hypothetical protein